MPVDVRPVVLIHRPRPEVAAFMFNPANDLAWTGGITSSRPAQPGPLVTGATVERTAKFLGRRFTCGYVVTAHDPDRLVELKVDKPFPMTVRYELDDTDNDTLVAIHATGTPGRFFWWATPFMTRQVHKKHRGRPRPVARLPGALKHRRDVVAKREQARRETTGGGRVRIAEPWPGSTRDRRTERHDLGNYRGLRAEHPLHADPDVRRAVALAGSGLSNCRKIATRSFTHNADART